MSKNIGAYHSYVILLLIKTLDQPLRKLSKEILSKALHQNFVKGHICHFDVETNFKRCTATSFFSNYYQDQESACIATQLTIPQLSFLKQITFWGKTYLLDVPFHFVRFPEVWGSYYLFPLFLGHKQSLLRIYALIPKSFISS